MFYGVDLDAKPEGEEKKCVNCRYSEGGYGKCSNCKNYCNWAEQYSTPKCTECEYNYQLAVMDGGGAIIACNYPKFLLEMGGFAKRMGWTWDELSPPDCPLRKEKE